MLSEIDVDDKQSSSKQPSTTYQLIRLEHEEAHLKVDNGDLSPSPDRFVISLLGHEFWKSAGREHSNVLRSEEDAVALYVLRQKTPRIFSPRESVIVRSWNRELDFLGLYKECSCACC